MKKLFAFAALLALSPLLRAQSVTGIVTDEAGEPLMGATVTVIPGGAGTVTDQFGYYRLKLKEEGSYELEASFMGYQPKSKTILLEAQMMKLDFKLEEKDELLDAVNISAVRAAENTPIAKSNLSEEQIEARDQGRDMPFILRDLPSTVVSSDAGAGIGYTGMRIRGSDITRINVTVNGIPLNDPESHGVFWVNTPDLASSTNSLQVQRGVGTSTNGAGAFGASINLLTSGMPSKPYAASELTAGSFNTLKSNLQVGSGLLNNHWAVEARLSSIQSDGFIDRAQSDLRSYYLSGSYFSKNTSVQLIHFGGAERTYQAWWGIPEAKLNNNDSLLQAHIARNEYRPTDSANLVESDPRTYNYYTYENEVDNYKQDHYQLHLSHRFGQRLSANMALHYTWGRGYYEQYRNNDELAHYGLNPVILGSDTIASSDIIRRRWLNNGLAGATYSIEHETRFVNLTLGGALNRYDGDHYGEIIWARYASDSELGDRYYDNNSIKYDGNSYLKASLDLGDLSAYADLQYRVVTYTGNGIDDGGSNIAIDDRYDFLNPKAGFSYDLANRQRVYASVAVAHREPVRSDFLDAPTNLYPQPEQLTDYEAGYEWSPRTSLISANLYYMHYRDQLVLTGQLNDVGSPIRVNVPESYRLGVELVVQHKVNSWLQIGGNLSLSENRILDYTDYVFDYGSGSYDTTHFSSTDISFSPGAVGSLELAVQPFQGFQLSLLGKYVGRQYLDNTTSIAKSLKPYTVTDLRLQYDIPQKFARRLQLHLLISNLMDVDYAPNGYTYSYIWGEKVTENFYYPMAGINFLGGIKLGF